MSSPAGHRLEEDIAAGIAGEHSRLAGGSRCVGEGSRLAGEGSRRAEVVVLRRSIVG
jgi:hypothetical protein